MQSFGRSTIAPESSGVSARNWAKAQPTPQLLSSEELGWKHLSLYRFRQPANFRLDPPPVGEHLIVVQLAHHSKLELHLSGEHYSETTGPGSISLMGASQENSWVWDRPIDELQLLLKPALLEEMANELFGKPVQLRNGVGLQDPWIYQLSLRLMADVESMEGTTRLFGDIMAQNLALQLLRTHSTEHRNENHAKRAMTRAKLRQTLDFIEARLSTDISVDDIARELGMSSFHFSHCFKSDMGVSPYQYVLKMRLERAASLLRSTVLPIIQIANDLGFPSQSHFTTTFKKGFGATPSSYRQQFRN